MTSGFESAMALSWAGSVLGSALVASCVPVVVVLDVVVVVVAAAARASVSSSNVLISASPKPLDLRNSTFFSLLDSLTDSSCRNFLACSNVVAPESPVVEAACCHEGIEPPSSLSCSPMVWAGGDVPKLTGSRFCLEEIKFEVGYRSGVSLGEG